MTGRAMNESSGPDTVYHRPVMVIEVLKYLGLATTHGSPRRIFDGTVGGGGHAAAILDAVEDVRLLAVDRDPDALARASERLDSARDEGRVQFLRAAFDEAARRVGVAGPSLHGALLDLGISSHQIDADARGFTFRDGAPLDMRMGKEAGARATAADLLAELGEDELRQLLRRKGEEPRARVIARAIVEARTESPLETSDDLTAVMGQALGRPPLVKEKARVFQALRIEVNDEIGSLERALPALRDALLPGGVLVVIAYHSLEDRPVKRTLREWSRSCICPPELPVCRCRGHALGELLTRSVVRPSDEEVEANPRARSARLRAWRKAP